MSQYTYTLNPGAKDPAEKNTYRRSQLEKMTTFQLREICRKERLVSSDISPLDKEGFIRLIMRFRGQKDYRHITEFCEGGLKRLQILLDSTPMDVKTGEEIQIPASLVLYMDMAVDEVDGYQAQGIGTFLYEGNLLLVDENYQIHTCLYLKENQGDYWICKGKDVPIVEPQKHQYSILYFPSERISELLYDRYYGKDRGLPGSLFCIQIPLLDLELCRAEKSRLPLVIDFGSCNTTMGICLPDGSINVARCGNGHVIPSLIGVSGIHGETVEYVFGYDAMALSSSNYLDQDVPVFYDIKRWISDPERKESVIVENGAKVLVCRKDMLKAFFLYLIDMARKQFKCSFQNIQILAPIRQKERFRELFQELLPEAEVDCTLDEGVAVLFSSIDHLISSGNYEQDHWYQALIIDCGGGTTDLTSGRFRIHSSRISYNVDLETSYENGDTNFGGNNLTYRIMQLLKICISRQIQLLGQAEAELSGPGVLVEDVGSKNPYERLEEQYRLAEKVFPTRFKEYADRGREIYFYVKNNYYYLFQLAEQIKKSFFQSGFQYELCISTEKMAEEERKQHLFLDKWKMSVMENGHLKRLEKKISFSLYLHQIEEILRPDIYQVMERFLKHKFQTGELSNYEMIKLTGQSCKSRLFEEALKEYVPGVLIQRSSSEARETELKMCCLEGALSYFFNRKLGYMNVSQSYQVGALPYEIMSYTHEGKAKTLVRSLDREGHIGYISRFMIGKQLDIHLLDVSGKELKTSYFTCDMKDFERTTQQEINTQYAGTVIQEETDIIQEGEMKFFVWVSRKHWGFVVLPVMREKELLYKGKETFFAFEDDTWEENFFNGRK